ncbi:protein kinase domain-containing protein [Phormidesmis sp. 146-35]
MVSSIPLGTLLRQRYLVKQILGQGGFGRTYLAIDQERFNESCVLKEFTVPYQDDALVEKAKSLFQREASTLYQIQHPQIPRFWAAFEDEQRLFLVQDFVKGQTYRSLLQTRKLQGRPFSEAEVLHFLNHLLPVLSYLHDRDIIHRDISPENIILRTPDTGMLLGQASIDNLPASLPVLIDFGAVKEAASHWPIISAITRVGKVGYAPPEQLQTGNVSPHSDLYALGATSLVLLTGREPQTLLDSQTLSWQWQPYARVSDLLATVLQKMLALQPNERYQSAREIWADLQPLMEESLQSTLLNPIATLPDPVHQDIAPAARDISAQVNTTIKTKLFMASHPEGAPSQPPPRSNAAHRLHSPRKVGVGSAIAASLLVSLGIGAYLFKITPPLGTTQAIDLQATRSTPHLPANNGQPQRIEFPPNEISAMVQGNLQDKNAQLYILEASQGQIMTVTLEGSGVVMDILRSNEQRVDNSAYQTRNWIGQLPVDDQYMIRVTGSGNYSVDVAITPLSRTESSETQRIKFPRGKAETTVTGTTQPNQIRRYILKAKGNQIMGVKVLQGKHITLNALAPNGQRVGGSSRRSRDWHGKLAVDGDYTIEVSSPKVGDFALSFEVY